MVARPLGLSCAFLSCETFLFFLPSTVLIFALQIMIYHGIRVEIRTHFALALLCQGFVRINIGRRAAKSCRRSARVLSHIRSPFLLSYWLDGLGFRLLLWFGLGRYLSLFGYRCRGTLKLQLLDEGAVAGNVCLTLQFTMRRLLAR